MTVSSAIVMLLALAAPAWADEAIRCDAGYPIDPEATLVEQKICELEFRVNEIEGYTHNVDALIQKICHNHPKDCGPTCPKEVCGDTKHE